MTKPDIIKKIFGLFDRPGLLAILSGLLTAFSFPSFGISFLAWIALVPLLIAIENSSPRTAFRLGITSGITAYAVILYWINIVLMQYGHMPWPVSLVMFLILISFMGAFWGLITAIVRYAEQAGIKSALTLPIAWIAFELIRSFICSGFPWAMLGHTQYRVLPLIQIADIAGVYGISMLIILSNAVVYRILRASLSNKIPYPAKSVLILITALLATLFYGFNRLNTPENPADKPIKVALIQGNISQNVKWSPEFRKETVNIYDRLTRKGVEADTDLIIWPESAMPFFFQEDLPESAQVRAIASDLKKFMVIGSPAYELVNNKPRFLNSAFVIAPNGNIISRGDKIHLVPFGEYIPFGKYIPFVKKMVVGAGDFSPGEKAVPIFTGKSQAGLLVCYEVIFPELAREYVRNGARFLINITNDAWFGKSSAPYQHLSITVFRAIENRTPLVRAANTGITAIIDQKGHIITMSQIFTEDFRRGEIIPGSADTLYLKFGDLPAWSCLVILAAIMLMAWNRNRKTKTA